MRVKLSIIFISLLTLLPSLYSVQAQSPDCAIDVQPIVAKLISAQTAAASGKQAEALQQITDAKAELEIIEANCTSEASSGTPNTATYIAPDEAFSFNYPEGWLTGEFTAIMEGFGKGGTARIANNEHALYALSKNVDEATFSPDDQAAMIIVGTPNGLLYSLGIYDETTVPKGISGVKALTEYLQLAIKDGPLFDEIGEPLYKEKSSQFTFADKEYEGMVMLKELSTDRYALTLVIGGKDTTKRIAKFSNELIETIH